jgi:hypothetical protein
MEVTPEMVAVPFNPAIKTAALGTANKGAAASIAATIMPDRNTALNVVSRLRTCTFLPALYLSTPLASAPSV